MIFKKKINCSFLMCQTWPKAVVVKLQINKNGQGSKGICGWIKLDKWYFHGSKLEIHIVSKVVTHKKFTHFEFFFKIT
jgi:hypothetical protein